MRLIEAPDDLREQCKILIPAGRLVTATISIAECFVLPLKDQDADGIDLYQRFFTSDDLDVIALNDEIARKSAELRVATGLRIPDSVHLATALACKANYLVSTDQDFVRCQGLDGLRIVSIPAV